MPKMMITCPTCGNNKERYVYELDRIYYCSNKCRTEGFRTQMLGTNNPNFGKQWSEDKRRAASERMIEVQKDPAVRYKSGSANRGKKLSKEVRTNMSQAKLGRPGVKHSEETKKKIGVKSKERANREEVKVLMRKRFEEKGLWVPLRVKESYRIYFEEANWIDSMIKYFGPEELDLFTQFGFFHNRTNTKGLVRDHMYSRRSGFENLVFPEILRHPCNCRLVSHSENVKKKKGRYLDGDILSLDTLLANILSYVGSWPEHGLCLKKIEEYKNGKRWEDIYKND